LQKERESSGERRLGANRKQREERRSRAAAVPTIPGTLLWRRAGGRHEEEKGE
jgi:hypothetical protein